MYCFATRRAAADHPGRGRTKPVLSPLDFLALLNQRLRAHPMYLEGMAFPAVEACDDHDDGSAEDASDEIQPLAQLVRDTRWDHFGIFASVIDEVKAGYELSTSASAPPACRQRLAPLGAKSAKSPRLRSVTI